MSEGRTSIANRLHGVFDVMGSAAAGNESKRGKKNAPYIDA